MRTTIEDLRRNKSFRDIHNAWLQSEHGKQVMSAMRGWACEPKALDYKAPDTAVARAYGEDVGFKVAVQILDDLGTEPRSETQEPEPTFEARLPDDDREGQ